MFERILAKVLQKLLGDYFQLLNSQNLEIGIWQGNVTIKNVTLKQSAIDRLQLPFHISYSRIACIKICIPWSSLEWSKMEVSIEGVEILLTEITEGFEQLINIHRL
jgi:vacuolar protein sorting-associated protein 13A/C